MLTCLIADDEAPARARLRRLLQPFEDAGRVRVAGEAGDGVEALALLEEAPVDLAFLDVKMPGLDGFGVLERVSPAHRPDVVFTTAYHDFALRAFEENAVDYLLKPVARERLEQSLDRAEARAAARRAADDDEPPALTEPPGDERLARLLDWLDAQSPSERPARPTERLRQLSVPHRDRLVILPVEAVVSIEVQDGITRIYALHDERDARAPLRQYLVPHTLEHLEAHLDPDNFLRVHRSALVQLRHIREMVPWFSGRYKLIMTEGHEVIASRERSRVLRDRLML
jgi:two-component system, LytTR family, response regulator